MIAGGGGKGRGGATAGVAGYGLQPSIPLCKSTRRRRRRRRAAGAAVRRSRPFPRLEEEAGRESEERGRTG